MPFSRTCAVRQLVDHRHAKREVGERDAQLREGGRVAQDGVRDLADDTSSLADADEQQCGR